MEKIVGEGHWRTLNCKLFRHGLTDCFNETGVATGKVIEKVFGEAFGKIIGEGVGKVFVIVVGKVIGQDLRPGLWGRSLKRSWGSSLGIHPDRSTIMTSNRPLVLLSHYHAHPAHPVQPRSPVLQKLHPTQFEDRPAINAEPQSVHHWQNNGCQNAIKIPRKWLQSDTSLNANLVLARAIAALVPGARVKIV
jgi:hypothetical protein